MSSELHTFYWENFRRMALANRWRFRHPLESRFGRYYQLSGAKYDVSLHKVYECEKKLRLLSVLKIKLHHKEVDIPTFDTDWCQFHDDRHNINTVSVTITINDLSAPQDYMPVITYIAGYCCYAVTKKLSCLHCTETVGIADTEGNVDNLQNELIKKTFPGGLLYPTTDVVHIVLISYIVINKISDTDEFKGSTCHRLATETTPYSVFHPLWKMKNFCFFTKNKCINGHERVKLTKMIVWSCTNTLLNNYCFKKKDSIFNDKFAKRKLKTWI